MKHGNEWERPGWVSFFENGRLVYSTGVGVRVHGGSSRQLPRPQGFRLYFRREYSATPLPGEIAFGPSHGHPLRRLILHNDLRIGRDRVRWHLVNPLAYDIATAVGAIASPTRPVRFLLNGEFQDVYVLSEHFHPRDFFVPHRGHPVSLNYDEFNQMWRQVRAMRPLRMAPVGHLVDLDNLTRWFIATRVLRHQRCVSGPRSVPRSDARVGAVVLGELGHGPELPPARSGHVLVSAVAHRQAARATAQRAATANPGDAAR